MTASRGRVESGMDTDTPIVLDLAPVVYQWGGKSWPGAATAWDADSGEKLEFVRRIEFDPGRVVEPSGSEIGLATVTYLCRTPDGKWHVGCGDVRTRSDRRRVRLVWANLIVSPNLRRFPPSS